MVEKAFTKIEPRELTKTNDIEDEAVEVRKQALRKQAVSVTPIPHEPNAVDNVLGVELGSSGEYAAAIFKPPSFCNYSRDIVITTVFHIVQADASCAMKLHIGCIKTDNSEARSYNVENGTAVNLDSTNAARPIKYEYTLAKADFEAGDVIYVTWELNEASRTVYVQTVEFEFYVK